MLNLSASMVKPGSMENDLRSSGAKMKKYLQDLCAQVSDDQNVGCRKYAACMLWLAEKERDTAASGAYVCDVPVCVSAFE